MRAHPVAAAAIATLVREAREEADNSLLFVNGDLIQGNPMGDCLARSRGLATSHPDGLLENATAELSKVDGIDAILFGHAHSLFPSEDYAGFPGADIEAGTLNGVPAVMPGFWGSPSAP